MPVALPPPLQEAAIDRLGECACAAREFQDLHRRLHNLGARGDVLKGLKRAEWWAWRELDRTRSLLFGTERRVSEEAPDL